MTDAQNYKDAFLRYLHTRPTDKSQQVPHTSPLYDGNSKYKEHQK